MQTATPALTMKAAEARYHKCVDCSPVTLVIRARYGQWSPLRPSCLCAFGLSRRKTFQAVSAPGTYGRGVIDACLFHFCFAVFVFEPRTCLLGSKASAPTCSLRQGWIPLGALGFLIRVRVRYANLCCNRCYIFQKGSTDPCRACNRGLLRPEQAKSAWCGQCWQTWRSERGLLSGPRGIATQIASVHLVWRRA